MTKSLTLIAPTISQRVFAQLTIDHKRRRYHETMTATGVNSRLSQVEVQALVTFRDDLRNVLPVDD